jgi:hypothetical protein
LTISDVWCRVYGVGFACAGEIVIEAALHALLLCLLFRFRECNRRIFNIATTLTRHFNTFNMAALLNMATTLIPNFDIFDMAAPLTETAPTSQMCVRMSLSPKRSTGTNSSFPPTACLDSELPYTKAHTDIDTRTQTQARARVRARYGQT